MNTYCQPLPPSVAKEMLEVVARTLCDLPSDTPLQRQSRARQMVHTTLGLQPRDGLEFMLSTLMFGHFQLILDSMRDALRGQADEVKGKTKTTIVSLDRSLLGFAKEYRLTRSRPLAPGTEVAQPCDEAAADPSKTPDWVAEWAGVPPAEPAPEAAAAPEVAATPETPNVSGASAKTTPVQPVATRHEPVRPGRAGDASTERPMTAFENALAAMAEARARDAANSVPGD